MLSQKLWNALERNSPPSRWLVLCRSGITSSVLISSVQFAGALRELRFAATLRKIASLDKITSRKGSNMFSEITPRWVVAHHQIVALVFLLLASAVADAQIQRPSASPSAC